MDINDYIKFISENKTERECVSAAEEILKASGFKELELQLYNSLKPGDKVYFKNKNKNIAAFVIGHNPRLNLLGAHIDSPRLDVKSMPLYEDTNMAYFDLQYYGGIKQYQWVTRPLAIRGVVYTIEGEKKYINLGDYDDDFTFCITDLLPHLDKTRDKRTASETVKGESLDLLLAAEVHTNSERIDPVKSNILAILSKKYDIYEEDLLSAELEVVPAGKASFVGLDKQMVGGYGQDDRVCAWTSLMALKDLVDNYPIPSNTCGCILVDKEEIGSTCATGSNSRWFEDVLRVVVFSQGSQDEITFANILSNSNMLSSDVTAAYDPLYADVSNKSMSAKLGGGFTLRKYNGGRGKSGGADANPEYIAAIRAILNRSNVTYQFDTMGKVDIGGGGTIASIVCQLNINVLDSGVPVLNMHSPFEITHVTDIENAYKGYLAFLQSNESIY